jgi:lysozyme family protein
MKKPLFGLLAIVSFVFNGIAQEKKDINQKADFKSASLITTYEKEITEYKFLSLKELTEETDQIIQEFDFSNSENNKQNTCEIKIEIKVEVAIGDTRGLVSGLIITNCIGATTAAKKLKAMLLAAAMG